MKRTNSLLPVFFGLTLLMGACKQKQIADRPNILFCISDDQSWVHTS